MLRIINFLFVVIFFFLLSTGCTQQDVKPKSSGKPGELIVVIDSLLWKSLPGQIIRDSIMAAFPAIPQYEPLFTIIQVQPEDFRNILQLHRNVLMIETGPLQGERNYLLTNKNNVWATPQIVLNLRALNEIHLESALLSVIPTVISKFSDEELKRMVMTYTNAPMQQTAKELQTLMGIKLALPEDFFIAKKQNNYVWVRKETIHTSLGFQFARIPYTNDSVFSPNAVIAIRDSLSKRNIPGPAEGSFMTTEINYPVSYSTIAIDSAYAFEVRGLWKTEGDFMGGPFICYLIHDKNKNELLFVDAFLYSPKFNKREYVKQMEALVKSIRF